MKKVEKEKEEENKKTAKVSNKETTDLLCFSYGEVCGVHEFSAP